MQIFNFNILNWQRLFCVQVLLKLASKSTYMAENFYKKCKVLKIVQHPKLATWFTSYY